MSDDKKTSVSTGNSSGQQKSSKTSGGSTDSGTGTAKTAGGLGQKSKK